VRWEVTRGEKSGQCSAEGGSPANVFLGIIEGDRKHQTRQSGGGENLLQSDGKKGGLCRKETT